MDNESFISHLNIVKMMVHSFYELEKEIIQEKPQETKETDTSSP
jgi:hypothetical protein